MKIKCNKTLSKILRQRLDIKGWVKWANYIWGTTTEPPSFDSEYYNNHEIEIKGEEVELVIIDEGHW